MTERRSPDKAGKSLRAMRLKALMSLGLLAGFGAVSTLAAWSGGATATSSIGAGTVGIGVGGTGGSASATYQLPIPAVGWYPGRSEAVMVTVKNTGTLSAAHAVTGTIAEAGAGKLGAGLTVKLTSGVLTGVAGAAACNGAVVLEKAAGAAFGAASAPQYLAPAGEQMLCIQYSLPVTAPTTLQGNTTTITLTFTSTVGSP